MWLRWAYSIPMVRRRPHFQTWISLKPLGQSWSNFMCTSLGWGKGCIRFWGKLDQNSDFHGNRKPPLTYNGENDVSTLSRLFLIRSFLYLQVTRTGIKSWTNLNFGQIGPLTTELAALERLKIPHRHKSSDEFDFGLDQTTHFGVTCPWMTKILHFRTWISLRPFGQSWSNFMCRIT